MYSKLDHEIKKKIKGKKMPIKIKNDFCKRNFEAKIKNQTVINSKIGLIIWPDNDKFIFFNGQL